MKLRRELLLMLLFCVAPAVADEAGDVSAFNAAWEEYTKAVESGRTDREVETSRTVAEIGERLFPETDERLALVLQRYGIALRKGRRYDEAIEVLERSLALMQAIHGEESIQVVPVIADLGDAHSGFQKGSQQLRYYKKALRIVEQQSGKESLEYADLAMRAATSTFNLSQSRSGKKYLVAAYEIYAKELGSDDLRTGMAAFHLGKMEFSARHNRKAGDYMVDALAAFSGEDEVPRKYRLVTRAMLVEIYESSGKSDLATEQCVAIGRESPVSPDQEYEPLFRAAPNYPRAMLSQGIEGHVDIEFTVDESGFVVDPKVVDVAMDRRLSGVPDLGQKKEDRSFDAAALAAVKRFRYAPRFEGGEAVRVDQVKTRITFAIEN